MRRHRVLTSGILGLFLATGLSACGGDSGSGGSGGNGSNAEDSSQSQQDFVTGDPAEWVAAACEGTELVEVPADEVRDLFGDGVTEGFSCSNQFDQGADQYSYIEGALYGEDPTEQWKDIPQYAIGQVGDNEWAVVFEDFADDIPHPHLTPLTEFGFTVYTDGEPVS